MSNSKVSVICPVRDANIGKWKDVEKTLNSLLTLSKYFSFYPSTSYHIVLQDIIEKKKLSTDDWSSLLKGKRDAWPNVKILLNERCRITPHPRISSMFFQETFGFILGFDTADANLISTIRRMASDLSNTHHNERVVIKIDLGKLIKAPPTQEDTEEIKRLNADVQILTTYINELFKIDDMGFFTESARLSYFYDEISFIPFYETVHSPAPVVQAPVAPDAPVVQAPAVPVVQAPAVQVVQAPAVPVVPAPVVPVVPAPVVPVVQAPVVQDPVVPVVPVVQAPVVQDPVVVIPAVSME